jgi:serine/threonine-protein kinase
VLAHLLLGKNIFNGATPEESRNRILKMPIPDFRTLDSRIDDRLNEILTRALARDLDKRYATADELLYDLEHYIYHSGYGPTNETLGRFIRELFGQNISSSASQSQGDTQIITSAPASLARP